MAEIEEDRHTAPTLGGDRLNAESPYTPPTIWSWNKESGGRFANINRPIAGKTGTTNDEKDG